MQLSKRLEYKPDPNKFDTRTHAWDAQGNLVAKNLYRSYIVDGTQYFERPVNSGNLFYANNQPAGRVELTFNDHGHIVDKSFEFGAEHKAYTAPLKGAEKVHFELEQVRERNAALEAELKAIKKDRTVTAAPVKAETLTAPTLKPKG